ncbi:GNAT family N-acetyltransferase [Chloroflexota bacterium]
MDSLSCSISIRPFRSEDSEACFRIRAEAYIREFYEYLGPEGVAAGVNAFMPGDYVTMAQTMPTFVADLDGRVAGFCVIRFVDAATADLLLIYVNLAHLSQGIGTGLAQHAEAWLLEHQPQVYELVVDTVIPRYNQAFYERLGFQPIAEHPFEFPGKTVRAVRLSKRLR